MKFKQNSLTKMSAIQLYGWTASN